MLLKRTPFDALFFVPGAGWNAVLRGVITLAAAVLAPLSLPSLQGIGDSAFRGMTLPSLIPLAMSTTAFSYWLLSEHAKAGYAPIGKRLTPSAGSLLVLSVAVFLSFWAFSNVLPSEAASSAPLEPLLKSLVMVETSIIACLLVTPLWEPKDADLKAVAGPAGALSTMLSPAIRERVTDFDAAEAYEKKWKRLSTQLDNALEDLLMTNPAIAKGNTLKAWTDAVAKMRASSISTNDYHTRNSTAYKAWTKAADEARAAIEGKV